MNSAKVRTLLVFTLCAAAFATRVTAEERSVWDKTRDGTVHAAKKTNAWIAHVAHKTDRFMNRAVEKVSAGGKSRNQQPAHPGPR